MIVQNVELQKSPAVETVTQTSLMEGIVLHLRRPHKVQARPWGIWMGREGEKVEEALATLNKAFMYIYLNKEKYEQKKKRLSTIMTDWDTVAVIGTILSWTS